MKAFILAAGKGSRLGCDTPKCLQLIGDQTILQRQLEALIIQNVRELVCVVGYKKEVVADAVKKIWPYNVTFVENKVYDTTNTSYSLYLTREYMNEDFFYMNADVVFRPDLLGRLESADGDAALGIQHKKCGAEEVKVVVKENRILEIGKDIDPLCCLGEFVGVALFRKSISGRFIEALSRLIQDGQSHDYFEAALKKITGDTVMTAVDITDIPCIEIDFSEDLKTAQQNARSYDVNIQKKKYSEEIKEARRIAQAPRIAKGEDWYSQNFTRFFSIYLSHFFWRIGISANSVTIWMGIICLLGSVAFVFNNIWMVAIGGGLWQLWYILDCVDGEVSRLNNKTSLLGEYLDRLSHIFINPTIPLAFGLHIYFRDPTIINAVCAFFLYSTNTWGESMAAANRQISSKDKKFAAVHYEKRSFSGALRLLLASCFTLVGQMNIFPILIILSFFLTQAFINLLVVLYTTACLARIGLIAAREIIAVNKIDILNG